MFKNEIAKAIFMDEGIINQGAIYQLILRHIHIEDN